MPFTWPRSPPPQWILLLLQRVHVQSPHLCGDPRRWTRNLPEEETLTSLDSTYLKNSRCSEGGPVFKRAFLALEEGKAPFVDEETETQIIETNLLQLLGIHRQAGRQGARDGRQKLQGGGGGRGPTLLSVTSPPCDSDLGPGPANTNAPQRQAGSQGSGLLHST